MTKLKKIILLSILVISSSVQAKVDAVICNGKLFSIDYLLSNYEKKYGDIYKEGELKTGTFPYSLFLTIVFEKAAPDLRPALGIFLNNLLNESDLSQPMYWQASSLALPKETLLAKDWPGLAQCAVNGKIEALSIVQSIRQGQAINFEYDQKLFANLKTSDLQLSFLYVGAFLRLINNDLTSLYNINGLIHSLPTIGRTTQELNSLFIKYGMKHSQQTQGTCNRSNYVVVGLQKSSGLPCEITGTEDLLQIEKLEIKSEKESTWVFQSNDFQGLANLNELIVHNFGREIMSIPLEEFSFIPKLKKLTISNMDINQVPLNFMDAFTGLTYLELSNNNIFEFKENVFRKIFTQEMGIESEVILDLSNNNSRWSPRRRVYIHPGTFNNCQTVTKLLMKNMNITKLDSSVFSTLQSLEELDLSDNNITEFPWAVIDLPKLKILHFCNPNFTLEKLREIKSELLRRKNNVTVKWCGPV
jgi:hypothetical protein